MPSGWAPARAAATTGEVDPRSLCLRFYRWNEPTLSLGYFQRLADLVANGLIASEELISNRPEVVAAFVRATLKGIHQTIADPDGAYQISKQFVDGLDDSRKNVLDASIELWRADVLGQTTPESWQRTQDALLAIGFLDGPLEDLGAAFTNEFIFSNQP